MSLLEMLGAIVALALVGWFVLESNKILEDRDKQRNKDDDAT